MFLSAQGLPQRLLWALRSLGAVRSHRIPMMMMLIRSVPRGSLKAGLIRLAAPSFPLAKKNHP
eukprot:10971891-Lingulodinium_polyedra.AAC.1